MTSTRAPHRLRSPWTTPSIILTIIGFLMTIFGSYMAVERSSQNEIKDLERRVAVIETKLAWIGNGEDKGGAE